MKPKVKSGLIDALLPNWHEDDGHYWETIFDGWFAYGNPSKKKPWLNKGGIVMIPLITTCYLLVGRNWRHSL